MNIHIINYNVPIVLYNHDCKQSFVCCFFLSFNPNLILLLQEFLKKEFSEENILFWQACEFFSHVPENDKKQVTDTCASFTPISNNEDRAGLFIQHILTTGNFKVLHIEQQRN